MRRLSPLPLALFVAAALLLLGLLAALDGSPTTWARTLDDTPSVTATDTPTDTATPTATDTPSPTPTRDDGATATPTATETLAETTTPTATATPTIRFVRYLPLLSQASGMRSAWRCWPDERGPSCGGPTPTPTATWTPIPTGTPQPTPVVLPPLNSITMISPSDGWVVGAGGSILHWDGQRWGRVASPTTNTLNAVSKVSATNVWAVGDGGTILHWDGAAWRVAPSNTPNRLTTLKMVSATDGWAGGEGGVILRWNGQAWQPSASTGGPTPLSIDMLSPTEGWLVGTDALAMHWNGAQWQKITLTDTAYWPGPFAVRSVSMVSPTDVWAVGHPYEPPPGTTESGGFVFHWDGSQWSATLGPTHAPLYGVSMRSATDGWAVGYKGHIIHWDGHNWLPYPDLAPYPGPGDSKQAGEIPTWARLFAVAAVSANDAWAVGEDGVFVHWNGQTWSPTYSLPTLTPTLTPTATGTPTATVTPTPTATFVPVSARLNSVTMLSPSDGWAVGEDGAILRWNGATWRYVPSPTTETLTAVTATSATDAWAASDQGTILHWNGALWRTVYTSNQRRALRSVLMRSADDGWAVGGKEVYRFEYVSYYSREWRYTEPEIVHWNGVGWAIVPWQSGTVLPQLFALAATPGGHVWAVGDGLNYYRDCDRTCSGRYDAWSSILHWDGVAWTEMRHLPSSGLRGIAMPSENEGWVVGNNGLVLHWDGQTWSDFPKPTLANLNAIAMLSPTDGWIVGDAGTILHWDGAAWNTVESPTWANLLAVTPLGPYDGWIVGRDQWNDGVLLKYSLQASPAFTTPTATRTSTPTPTPTSTATPTLTPTPTYIPVVTEDLTGITMVSATEGWAVGNEGSLLRWDGERWAAVANAVGKQFVSVSRVSPADVWVGGETGFIMRWDGAAWHNTPTGVSDPIAFLSMLSSTDGWAVVQPNSAYDDIDQEMLHWDGTSWQRSTVVRGRIYGMHMRSSTDGWMVSWLGALRWNGTAWTRPQTLFSPGPVPGHLLGVYVVSPSEVWFVGSAFNEPLGYVWRGDGHFWTPVGEPWQGWLGRRLTFVTSHSIWGVGEGFLHWDGADWTSHSIVPGDSIRAVAGLSESDAWAVGNAGRLYHWNGQSWTRTTQWVSPTPTLTVTR